VRCSFFFQIRLASSVLVHWSHRKCNMCSFFVTCSHRSSSNALKHWSQTISSSSHEKDIILIYYTYNLELMYQKIFKVSLCLSTLQLYKYNYIMFYTLSLIFYMLIFVIKTRKFFNPASFFHVQCLYYTF
jgi:hypothetical protein